MYVAAAITRMGGVPSKRRVSASAPSINGESQSNAKRGSDGQNQGSLPQLPSNPALVRGRRLHEAPRLCIYDE